MSNEYYDDKVVICLPRFTYFLLQEDIARFNFCTADGKDNENAFFNHLLPNMISFRDYKKGALRNYIDKNIKSYLLDTVQEKVLNFLENAYDFIYFDDAKDFENDVRINLRISKENLQLMTELFMRLDAISVKKSTYLRTLLSEYCNMPNFKREAICFRKEYNTICDSINRMCAIHFLNNKKQIHIYPLALEYSHAEKSGWFVIGIDTKNENLLHSIPIKSVSHLISNIYQSKNNFSKKILKKIQQIIEIGTFSDFEALQLMEDNNA